MDSFHAFQHPAIREVLAPRRGDWKLIGKFDNKTSSMHHSLHHLAEPQPEVKDHASGHPEIVRELTALHEAWANQVELKSTGGYRIQK